MAISKPKLSRIIAQQLPEFIREDYPTFVAFLEAYYEYLESQDTNLYDIRDIDKTLDNFITYFKSELSPQAVDLASTDQRFLLSHIKDAHLAKGSPASYKLLFRLMYNKNVTVDFPGKQILRASDGRWNQDVSIFAKVNAGNPDDIVGRLVDVVTPNRVIRVLVDRRQDVEIEVDRYVQISPDTYEFYVDRRFFGDISIGDRIRYQGIFDAKIIATTAKITIQQRGKNFKVGQLYNIKNGLGAGSVLKVKSVDSNGGIQSAEFVKYGIGYETDFTATILAQQGQATTGTGQTALSVSTINSGVTSIQINSGGSGYTSDPTVALSGGGFTNAATIGSITRVGGVITEIKVLTPGAGYTAVPDVIITGGGGTGASATATIGEISNYGVFETTDGFVEQGYINTFDYARDTPTVWTPLTYYAAGTELYAENRTYTVTVAGTSSSTLPTHTSGSATNGSMTLAYSRVYGAAFEGTYSGEVVREFFNDSKEQITDPAAPAIVSITLGPLTKYPGYYRTNDGFLDDAIFIQDSYYYQAFSYVVKIDEKLESYKSAVKTLIHPSGLALFGEYDIRNEFDISVSLQSMVKILVVNAQDEFSLTSDITAKDFGKALDDTFGTSEVTTLLVSKPLTDSATPTDSISTKGFGKALSDTTNGFTEAKTFSVQKPLADSVTPTENNTFAMTKPLSDSASVTEQKALRLNKYINASNDIATPTDSGGAYFLNPYVADPYPSSYWSSNYTVGETTFS